MDKAMKLTNEELGKFSDQLAKRFLTEVAGLKINVSIEDAPKEVQLIPRLKAKEIASIKNCDIGDNEIYFYTKTKKKSIYSLLRHFRNCASHKGRIERKIRNGKDFFKFEVINMKYFSMRGNVAVDLWDEYIDKLYDVVIKNRINRQ